VNALLESGVKLAAIATEVGQFNQFQLSRHKNKCILKPLNGDSAGSQDIEQWLERLNQTYLLASSQGDSKGATAACSAAARALQSLHKKLEREAEAAKAGTDERYSVQALDQQVKDFLAQRDSERGGVATKAACLCEEESKFGELVQAIWANRALLPALLAASASFISQREVQHVNVSAND